MSELERIYRFESLMKDKITEEFLNFLVKNGFFTSQSSLKYHGNYEGGNYDHSEAVTLQLEKWTDELDIKWQREESPYIIGMFHDLCKMDNYLPEVNEYNKEQLLTGHGEKSLIILLQYMKLTEEEILCIRYHMGSYFKEDWDQYDLAIKKYETVLWTHMADMYASKVKGM